MPKRRSKKAAMKQPKKMPKKEAIRVRNLLAKPEFQYENYGIIDD